MVIHFFSYQNLFAQENEFLTIYTELYEPFIIEKENKLTGPYIDSFKKILTLNNIKYELSKAPNRRSLKTIEKEINTCVFSTNYSPESSETSLYVSKLSKMKIWAFTLKSNKNIKVNKLKDLKKYNIGAIDISEVSDILSTNSIEHTSILRSSSATKMLLSKRFDILISDINLDIQNDKEFNKIQKLMPIITVEKWLICNQKTNPILIKKLKEIFKKGLFADSVKDIWANYNLIDIYNASK